MNFLPTAGTNSGDCATSSNNPICYYAKLNGYNSTTNNDVSWSTSIVAPSSLPSGAITKTSNGLPAFLNVTVTDNVPAAFFGVFAKTLGMSNSWSTVQVKGYCHCGLVQTSSTVTNTQSIVSAFSNCSTYQPGPCSGWSSTSYGQSQTVPSPPITITVTLSASIQGYGYVNGSGSATIICNKSGYSLSVSDNTNNQTSGSTTRIISCNVSNLNQISASTSVSVSGCGTTACTQFASVSVSGPVQTTTNKLSAVVF